MSKWNTGDFQGSETILRDPVMVDNNEHLAKLIKQYNAKSKPQCKLWNLVNSNVSNIGSSLITNVPHQCKMLTKGKLR